MKIPIGSTIKFYRKKEKLTQQKLGDLVGLSEKTIGSYENHKNEPDLETLVALANCFGITLTDLIQKTEGMMGMNKTTFIIDYLDCVEYEGYNEMTEGVFPLFKKETALNIIKHIELLEGEGNARYDEKTDTFWIVDQRDGEWEAYEGYDIISDGQEVRVYPIGSNVWLWEEAEKQNS